MMYIPPPIILNLGAPKFHVPKIGIPMSKSTWINPTVLYLIFNFSNRRLTVFSKPSIDGFILKNPPIDGFTVDRRKIRRSKNSSRLP